MEKLHGIVKSWEDNKGFGFIEHPDEADLFVHFSALINMRVRSLEPGQKVSYVIAPGIRGDQAALVELEN